MENKELINKLNELISISDDLSYKLFSAEDMLIDTFPGKFLQYDTPLSSAAIDMNEVSAKIKDVINKIKVIPY